ncbi:unnamed protein product [Symbiodinium sp. CCMP2592]|nr:unnamed protein product [Symbiodinium sp. CCMP2592]
MPTRTRKPGSVTKPVLTLRRVRDTCLREPALLPEFSAQVTLVHAAQPQLRTAELLTKAWHYAVAQKSPHALAPRDPGSDALAIPLESLWTLRRRVRGTTLSSLTTAAGVWRHWRNVMLLNRKQRELHRHCRRLKQERLARLLADAAAARDGLTGVFQLLRGLAPKAPRRKLQLRAQDGMPLSSLGTITTVKTYYLELFNQCHSPTLGLPPPIPLQITHCELKNAIARLPANKALPKAEAPALLWREAAEVLAGKCLPLLNSWLCDMRSDPPENLNVAEICLIPKPSKPLIGPESLRPISLLPPLAKALAAILNHRIQPQLQLALGSLPQFAYSANRGVADAVDRAFTHCSAVRAIMRTQQQTIHLRRQGHQPEGCRGGLTLSLDLQKAFDLMPRAKLQDALEQANIDSATAWTIMNIHDRARMQFRHGEHVESIGTSNGVRQGCGLAPSLWTLFTCLILRKLSVHIPLSCITAYADDLLIQWIINTQDQLLAARRAISYVFQVLQEFGMKISVEKTVVLLGLRGKQVRNLLRQFVVHDPHKGRVFRVPMETGEVRLPIVTQHTYLGVQLSYDRFEHQLRTMAEELTLTDQQNKELVAADSQIWLMRSMLDTQPGMLAMMATASQAGQGSSGTTTRAPTPSAIPLPDGENLLETEDEEPQLDSLRDEPPPQNKPEHMDTSSREGKRGDRRDEEHRGKGDRSHGRHHKETTQSWGSRGSQWKTWSRDERSGRQDTGAWKPPTPKFSDRELRELCVALARLALRHEDQFSIDRTESGFILFLQTQGVLSMVPELVKVSEVWKQTKTDKPEEITLPLRAVLLQHLLTVMTQRLAECTKTEQTLQEARDMMILDSQNNVPYLGWDKKDQCLKVRTDKEPMTLDQAAKLLQELQALILLPHTVLRFHSTRKMVRDHGGQILPMMLQLGMFIASATAAFAAQSS